MTDVRICMAVALVSARVKPRDAVAIVAHLIRLHIKLPSTEVRWKVVLRIHEEYRKVRNLALHHHAFLFRNEKWVSEGIAVKSHMMALAEE